MKIVGSGTVVASQPDTDRQSCAFSGVCVFPNGRWLCGFRGAPTKTCVGRQGSFLTRSDDEGKTWSSPIEPFVPPDLDGRRGQFRAVQPTALGGGDVLAVLYWVDASNPDLPFFNEETQGLLDSKIFLAKSNDTGQTWSKPWLIDTSPFNQPTPITGPVLKLANGELGLQFELNNHYYDRSVWRHSSVIMFSKDGGKTFPTHAIAGNDPDNRIFYWDQRPAVLADGRILDLFWTYDNQAGVYLNNHARESRDHGRTWSRMWDTGVTGQPAPAVELSDGGIGMVYVDRTAAPVIKIRTSADGGHSWPADTELQISQSMVASQTEKKATMQDAWSEMSKFSVGLPSTARTKNGDVLVIYYAGADPDHTDIKWARLRV